MNGFEPVKEWIYQYTDAGHGHVDSNARIVRCRDCFWFNDYHDKCHRTATIIDVDGNVYVSDDEGWMSMTDAQPDGFCAWGERKADE